MRPYSYREVCFCCGNPECCSALVDFGQEETMDKLMGALADFLVSYGGWGCRVMFILLLFSATGFLQPSRAFGRLSAT